MLTSWITGREMIVSWEAGLVEAPGPGLLTVNEPVPWFWRSEALRATCKTVVLTTVVGRAHPFHITWELVSNPVPVIVMVAALPESTFGGEIAVMIGAGLFTSNVAGGEVPPPGAGFCIAIWLAELPVRSAAGTVAFSSVALTNVVVSAVPFHSAVEVEMNPVPVIVTVVSVEPATVDDGLSAVMTGRGFEFGGGFVVAVVPAPQPLINHVTRIKTSSIPITELRPITALHEIKANILSNRQAA